MTIDDSEKGFEDSIEAVLLNGGYKKRESKNFDKELAIDPEILFEFIQKTQNKKWLQIQEMYGTGAKDEILRALDKELQKESMIHVIRNGFSVSGVNLYCAYFKPVSSLNPEAKDLYEKNILSFIRQARYSQKNENALDLLLFLNGLPVATAELKNTATRQNYQDAIQQYKDDRDPNELLFRFKKRALVHFAIDPYEVHMTTRLDGDKTRFLPFNKGQNKGAGNPDNPNGHRTSYLWEVIWQKDSWLDILANFVNIQFVEQKKGIPPKEYLIFPRYHQLDAVLKLTEATKKVGTNYLIQHSTGSGKSNTIAWLAYKLFSLFNEQDKPMFDGIIVLSDRIAIVDQLKNTIMQFEQTPGTCEGIENSTELAENLEQSRKILITTQQKFPFVIDKINQLKGRNFAIIIDEAHSSQSGESADKVKEVLTKNQDQEKLLQKEADEQLQEEDSQKDLVDRISDQMEKRGPQGNLSYYAFTATPRRRTFQLFGIPISEEIYLPFHEYTMRQAIEENFILDVLKNYTTYERYFKILKIGEDKIVEGKKASKALLRYVDSHHLNLQSKAKIIVEHFRTHCKPKIGGKAKAMVVASGRYQAYRYKQEIDDYIKEQGYSGINTLVAFSGTLSVDGQKITEHGINKTSTDQELRDKFDTDDYNIMIVAEKYQTGYDQPLLHTMYVDKKLHSIKAVQTLSRLNRTAPGKVDTFVVDFQNTVDEIKNAYKGFYEGTILVDKTEPTYVFALYDQILDYRIITESDLDKFAEIFFKSKKDQVPSDHGKLYASMDPVIDRFNETEEPQQDEFKLKLVKYIETYSFLTKIISYADIKLEKLYAVAKFLANERMLQGLSSQIPELQGDVSLQWYRLEKTHEGDISINGQRPLVARDTDIPPKPPEVLTSLSEVIRVVNQRFGGQFSDADVITIQEWENILKNMPDLRLIAEQNEFSDFLRHFEARLQEVMLESMEQNQSLVSRIFTNPEFKREVTIKAAEMYHSWARSDSLVITSDKPLQNKQNFRSTINRCKGFVHWIDLFVGKDGLEFFLNSFDQDNVKEIKILTSLYNNEYQINEQLREIFQVYQKELEQKGISIQMKLVSSRSAYDKVAHDRYVIGKNIKYNVPSYTTVIKGRLSEIKKTSIDIPFENYWSNSEALDIIKDWEKIKTILDKTRPVFKYTCADCRDKFELTYKLPEGRPAYCPKCFQKHRRIR